MKAKRLLAFVSAPMFLSFLLLLLQVERYAEQGLIINKQLVHKQIYKNTKLEVNDTITKSTFFETILIKIDIPNILVVQPAFGIDIIP